MEIQLFTPSFAEIFNNLNQPNCRPPFFQNEYPQRYYRVGEDGYGLLLDGCFRYSSSEYGDYLGFGTAEEEVTRRAKQPRLVGVPRGQVFLYDNPTEAQVLAALQFSQGAFMRWQEVSSRY